VWILVCFLFLLWGDGSCSLVCQAGIHWYTMCSYCVLMRCETCIFFLFCYEDWWKLLPCLLMLLMLFIIVKMIVSTTVCKWVVNIVSATMCMRASVWNICMCYCNCCLSCWICHRFNWNTCSLWCSCCWSSYIYKLCLFCEVSIEFQLLLFFRWFRYMFLGVHCHGLSWW
jgi:hypothetical protein